MEYIFDIFKLIEKSLKNEKHSFFVVDEKKFTQSLIENGLVGLVFEYIDPKSFKNQSYYNLLKEVFKGYVYQDIQQQNLIQTINDKFNEAQIKHIFLKGAHLKKIYPQSYMRGMGDIDVLVPENDVDSAKEIFIKLGFKHESSTSHHHSFIKSGLIVELHQKLYSINDFENSELLKDVFQYANIVDNYLYDLDYSYEYVYLLSHLVRHIRSSGVGLRSILDIYFFEEKYQNEIDFSLVQELLEKYSMTEFKSKIHYLNQIITNQLELKDQKDFEVIKFIMNSGIHGKGESFDSYKSKRVYEEKRKGISKIKYLVKSLFPKRYVIQEQYPYLKKYPWLLPWAWFVRILKQIFKPKNTKMRLKSLSNDEDVSKINDVFVYFKI